MGGDSSPAPAQSNTVTQVQQIPAFQQQAIQNDEATATSLASNPYPVYGAPIVAGLNAQEGAGLESAFNNAYSYAPQMLAAQQQASAADSINPLATDPTQAAGYGASSVTASNLVPGVISANNAMYNVGQQSNVTPQAQQTAGNYIASAGSQNPMAATSNAVNNYQAQASAGQANNPAVIASYMNPYIQQSLAPQLFQAQQNLDQQQNVVNQGATAGNAFGDSRQATQSALANYYGGQTMAGIEAQGLNTGYNNAVTAAQNQQNVDLQQAQTANNLGTLGINEQNVQNSLANTALGIGNLGISQQNASNAAGQNQIALGNMGIQEQGVMQNQQTLGLNEQGKEQSQQQIDNANAAQQLAISQQLQSQVLTGANAQYNAGNILQTNQQQQLNAAYQQYENQVNWPYQQLNVMESAVNSSPYQLANATTLPQANSSQAGLNAFTGLAGTLGSLYNNSGSSTSTSTGTA